MKKKLLCLFLCLVTLMSMTLTSCGGTNDKNTTETDDSTSAGETTRLPMTLSLWLPTDGSTTDEAIEAVEAEINRLTQAKYNTAIELHAIDSDDYQKMIDKKITDIDDVKKSIEAAEESSRKQELEDAINGILADDPKDAETEAPETEAETAETLVNEYGQTVDVYPEVEDDQLDIFLVKGYDKYVEYIDNELIQPLDSELADVGKKLYSYIYPSFFDLAMVNGSTYAIPNNHTIGEYELLLVNKDLVKQYDYSADELTKFVDCETFITDIGSQNIAGVTPLLSAVEPANMVYFSSDGNWSVIAQQLNDATDDPETNPESLTPRRVFDVSGFSSTLGIMSRLNSLGYVGNGNTDGKFAVGVVKGDGSLYDKYEDEYYINIHAQPVADREEALESAFAVSTYSKDVSRSMEIITYLNTNEEIRTILQYGVEGVHWTTTGTGDDKALRILSDDYKMNIVDTGNEFLTYPGDGLTMNDWARAKQQNLDSVMNIYEAFEYVTDGNDGDFRKLANISSNIYKQLQSLTPSSFEAQASAINGSLVTDVTVGGLLSKEATEDVTDTLIILFNMYYNN